MKPYQLIVLSFVMITFSLVIRIFGYFITGNIALAMESWHIGIDVIITVFILITLRLISGEYSRRFSYGLFKLEDLISLALSVIVAFTGFDLLITGLSTVPPLSLLPSIFQAISVIPVLFAGYFKVIAGRGLKSPSLEGDGRHTYTDFYEGAGVSAGLMLSYYLGPGFFHLSVVIAFAALIFTSYSIGRGSVLSLLDLPREKGLKEKISEIAASVDGIRSVKEVRLRWAGPVIFAELVVEMDPLITIDDAHPVTEEVERRVRGEIEGIHSIVVHVEPVRRKRFRLIIPSRGKGEDSPMDERLARAEFFAIVDVGDGIEYTFVENPFREKSDLAGLELKDFLVERNVTDIICTNVGEITFGLMLSYGIYCWHSDVDKVSNVVDKFIRGELRKLGHPTRRSKGK